MKTILITGGGGYIGSNIAVCLIRCGHKVRILDNFPRNNEQEFIDLGIEVLKGDIRNIQDVLNATQTIDLIIHLAATKSVTESAKRPEDYYMVNVFGTLNIMMALKHNGFVPIIFSSTAAVYSSENQGEIVESAKTSPVSVYGQTKKTGEELLIAICKSNSVNLTIFRLFNVAGASLKQFADRSVENIFPILFSKVRENEEFTIFGKDHLTPDGTCVRDYIHIDDLIEAFRLETERMLEASHVNQQKIFNLGSGTGSSVLEVVQSLETIIGQPIKLKIKEKRPEENSASIASIERIVSELSWHPRYALTDILASAWNAWE